MNTPNCLEAAMFAASESYSLGVYEFIDCPAEEAEETSKAKPGLDAFLPRVEMQINM